MTKIQQHPRNLIPKLNTILLSFLMLSISNAAFSENFFERYYVKASNSESGSSFGQSIAIDGDTMVVGAPSKNLVYIYKKHDNIWEEFTTITGSNTADFDYFGRSVAISGDTIVVGATGEDSNATGVNGNEKDNSLSYAGAAYIFTLVDEDWLQKAYLKASNTNEWNLFGSGVEISGDTIVISAPLEGGGSTGINGNQANTGSGSVESGAVYVFLKTNDTWEQSAYIKSQVNRRCAYFGSNLDFYEDNLIVSQFGQCPSIGSPPAIKGKVFLYSQSENNTWAFQTELSTPSAYPGDRFGSALAIDDNQIFIRSQRINTNSEHEFHSVVYVFNKINNNWVEQDFISSSKDQNSYAFGNSISVTGDLLVIGAAESSLDHNGNTVDNTVDNDTLLRSGAAYIFKYSEGSWHESQFIKISSPDQNDSFGYETAISGNTIVISAPEEDSNAIGLNGDQSNNDSNRSGAVFIYDNSFSPIQAAHSALWYNPNQSGHGLNIYMLADNRIVAIWYIYDNEGNPLWLLGVGTHDGISATLDVQIAENGMFPPNFNSDEVILSDWGKFKFNFSGCDSGSFQWLPINDNSFSAGQMSIFRLNQTLGLTCDNSLAQSKQFNKILPQDKSSIDASHSALWYNHEESGHGINVYMLEDNRIIVIWYVYDNNGKPIWLLGMGEHNGNKAILTAQYGSGAMFPPNFNTDDVNLEDWGTFELEFNDCNTGQFLWSPLDKENYSSGVMSIQRLNTTLGLACSQEN